MKQRRHEINIHKDMLQAQIKSSEEERQTVRYWSISIEIRDGRRFFFW